MDVRGRIEAKGRTREEDIGGRKVEIGRRRKVKCRRRISHMKKS